MAYVILFLGFVSAYLIGSIPTAYLFGRILKGIDIREYGSGNVGATNVFRVIGKGPGITVLVIDVLKGLLCSTVVASMFLYMVPVTRPDLYRIFIGLSAIAGHNWTVFLKFKGGKGVATSAGVVIGLIPQIFWLGFMVWLVVFFVSGFVSLASIIAAISIPLFTLAFGQPAEIVIFMCIVCVIIAYTHKANIKRLKTGEEKRVPFFKRK
ncbi:MAG: glycerol-3-phosphate 1-O-acyltransferase PlsY [Candidatus Omnitrophota bacterium]